MANRIDPRSRRILKTLAGNPVQRPGSRLHNRRIRTKRFDLSPIADEMLAGLGDLYGIPASEVVEMLIRKEHRRVRRREADALPTVTEMSKQLRSGG